MKKAIALVASVMLLTQTAALPAFSSETGFDPSGFVDWYTENCMYMSVENGHWSEDPADQISDEDLEDILSMAVRAQSSGDNLPWYYVVVKDVEEQRNIIGDKWGDPADCATEGTVLVLLYASGYSDFENTTPSEGSMAHSYIPWMIYDSGLSTGVLSVAAASKGYYMHVFGGVTGEYAPIDIDGRHQSLARYLSEDDKRINGFAYHEGDEVPEDKMTPVLEDGIFITAIVLGKPVVDETVEAWGSRHIRTENWKIWDGTVNEDAKTASDFAETEE